jgi:FMN phosphatase YigB (HAD superfamily)
VFSDEFGLAKPDPSIFKHTLRRLGGILPGQALHVGDIEELDVRGARRAGLFSALYAPGDDRAETDADFVVRDWRNFGDQIARFVMPG